MTELLPYLAVAVLVIIGVVIVYIDSDMGDL